ncbi:hypothetical protein ADUPG1_011665, partial [Aduncisulcus paluster]
IDLTNVIKCEITGKWKRTESFKISSLTFIRPETPEECSIRESKEKTWSDAPIVKPVLKCSGDKLDSYTINSAYEHLSSDSDSLEEFPYADGSAIIDPPFLRFKACADFLSKESRDYDQSSNACAILTRNLSRNTYLSVTLRCMDGSSFPLDYQMLSHATLKARECGKRRKADVLDFWKYEEEEEKEEEEEGEIDHTGGRSDSTAKHEPKHDSLTLTSASTIVPQCIIGSGGFGEVLLVKVDGIPFPCVLKKMLRVADKKVVKGCRKEFKVQLKLFTNPKCFNRIPRPLYIFDLLDAEFHGVYGFLMEFCVGGSVSSFAKSWCADGKYVSVDEDEDEASDSSSSSESFNDPDSPSSTPFNPMTLNPVK